jgi:hypothetical protein
MNRCGHLAYPSSVVADTGASAGISTSIAARASGPSAPSHTE